MDTATVSLGTTKVLVRYDYEPAEDNGKDAPSFPAAAYVEAVCIDGVWVDAGYFDSDWIGEAEAEAVESMERSYATSVADDAIDAREAA